MFSNDLILRVYGKVLVCRIGRIQLHIGCVANLVVTDVEVGCGKLKKVHRLQRRTLL